MAKIDLRDLAKSGKLKNKTSIKVIGKVNYSHIASKIDGEELKKANQYTQYPSNDPYFKLTIEVADEKSCMKFDKTNTSEAALAAYLSTKVYISKKEENNGKKYFSAISKGEKVRVYQKNDDGKLYEVDLNKNELGQDVNVELELNYFETSKGSGVGLNAVVILDKEIRTFRSSFGVKGYEVDTSKKITLASGDAEETAPADVSEAPEPEVEVASEPIGSTTAASNEDFDAILKEFQS